jgi:predicted nucleic acid-binding protein
MIYLDTSFLAPLVLAEESSDQVEATLARLPAGSVATSLWTLVEFSSLIGRRVRMRDLASAQAARVRTKFRQLIDTGCVLLVPGAADFSVAAELLENHRTGLRGGDALHLAIARNQGAADFYTLDEKLIRAARLLSIPARNALRRSVRRGATLRKQR